MIASALCDLLNLRLPVLAAAMGGVATPELAAAVSQAGAGGSIGLFRLTPTAVREAVRRTAAMTDGSFGIGLIPEIQRVEALSGQVKAALEASPSRAFFQFYGLPPAEIVARVKSDSRRVLVQVGSAADAATAAVLGADALILQGVEAGGHLLGTQGLSDLHADVCTRALGLPLIAAGGVSSGGDLFAVLCSGFDGALCGTLFACASESSAHPEYQSRILGACAQDTTISEAFEIGWPGRRHRVLKSIVAESKAGELGFDTIATTLVAGRKLPVWRYSAAVPTRETRGSIGEMAMYCGTGCAAITTVRPAAEILRDLEQDFRCVAAMAGQPAPISALLSSQPGTPHVRIA